MGLAGVWVALLVAAGADDGRIDVLKCQVKARADVEVCARIDGEIVDIPVREGQAISAGTVLARLEDSEARLTVAIRELEAENTAKIDAARQIAEIAKTLYEQNQKLHADKAISEFELRKSKAEYLKAEAELAVAQHDQKIARLMAELARTRLRDHEVRAPIDGVIEKRLRDVGEAVRAREPVFRLLDTRVVVIEGWVGVQHLRQVAEGQRVEVEIQRDGRSVGRYEGRVVFVSPEVDAASHDFRVKVEVDNAQGRIWAGDVARMSIRSRPAATTAAEQP